MFKTNNCYLSCPINRTVLGNGHLVPFCLPRQQQKIVDCLTEINEHHPTKKKIVIRYITL